MTQFGIKLSKSKPTIQLGQKLTYMADGAEWILIQAWLQKKIDESQFWPKHKC